MPHYFTFWSMEPPYRDGRLRYHLGQLFMLKQMEFLIAAGDPVASVICDGPSVLYARSRPQSRTQRDTIERFLQAVRPLGVDVYRLSELCGDARDYDPDRFKHIERGPCRSLRQSDRYVRRGTDFRSGPLGYRTRAMERFRWRSILTRIRGTEAR